MTIDGINTTAWGFLQSYIEGAMDSPARKKTITPQGYSAKDLVYEERVITVTLFGQFSDPQDAGIMVGELSDFLRASQVHTYFFTGFGGPYKGVLKTGFKTQIFALGGAVEISMPITITQF